MTPLPRQRTRLEGVLHRLGGGLLRQLRRSWRTASLSLLALLLGYYLGQNLTSLLLLRMPFGRPMVVLLMVLSFELVVRLRARMVEGEPSLGWVVLDNLRIGMVFAVVLEAFKLGT
jgi:hypothetical protein